MLVRKLFYVSRGILVIPTSTSILLHQCATPFIKSDGCNKITCSSCRSFVCYVCKQLLPKQKPYEHFCQKPHCNHKKCNKCLLYSKTEADDDRKVRQAVIDTAAEVRQANASLSINVDSILKQPGADSNKKRKSR